MFGRSILFQTNLTVALLPSCSTSTEVVTTALAFAKGCHLQKAFQYLYYQTSSRKIVGALTSPCFIFWEKKKSHLHKKSSLPVPGTELTESKPWWSPCFTQRLSPSLSAASRCAEFGIILSSSGWAHQLIALSFPT